MVQNGRISDFHGLLTLTLTLDPGMAITFFHLSSSTTCIPNFIEIEETFCGRTDGRTEICHPQYQVGRLPKFGSRPKEEGKGQRPRKVKKSGGSKRGRALQARQCESITGVWGRSPLKLKSFLLLDVLWKRQICTYSPYIADSVRARTLRNILPTIGHELKTVKNSC